MKQISYSQFESYFQVIFDYRQRSTEISDAVHILFGNTSTGFNESADKLCDAHVDLIQDYLDIKTPEILSWFIYENDIGYNELSLNDIEITCLEDLYNYLVKND